MIILNRKTALLLSAAVIVILGILVYSNTFHSSFHFDDDSNIVANYAIRNVGPATLFKFWASRFLTYFSFALNYHFHQLRVPGYHIVNLLIHLTAALLVWWLALLTFAAPALKGKISGNRNYLLALFGGLLFVCHPLQTEAVTYIVQRATSLATFFCLLSLCLYIRSRLLPIEPGSAGTRRWCYGGALLSGLAAMLTKETAVTLPLSVLLYEFCFLQTPKNSDLPAIASAKAGWKSALPFLCLLPLIPILTFTIQPALIEQRGILTQEAFPFSRAQYLVTQFRVMLTYLRLLFIPVRQNLDYDYTIYSSLLQAPVLASGLFLLLLLTAAILLFRKNRLFSFAVFWFFLTIAPESSFIVLKNVIFEHRLYLPLAGFCLFLPAFLVNTLPEKKNFKPGLIILLLLTVIYSCLAYNRNRVWQSELTLWNDTAQKSPAKSRPYVSRGMAYAVAGQHEKGLADLNRALEINPANAAAYCNRGAVYQYAGRYPEAIADYSKSIELNPRLMDAYYNRALAYEKIGRLENARSDLTRVIEVNPYDFAWYNRGRILFDQGDYDRAIADFSQAIKLNPALDPAYFRRGNSYRHKNLYAEALADYNRAIEINPKYGEAYNNRAVTLIILGRLKEAEQDVRQMVSLQYPFDPKIRQFLEQAETGVK